FVGTPDGEPRVQILLRTSINHMANLVQLIELCNSSCTARYG
ncbi:11468_t:CDS:1, partial [Gigaspora rosea]